jgi:small-conductance mechanosensitive channel
MKTLFLGLIIVGFSFFQPRVVRADDATISDSEREFQLEVERVDMRDLEGQANVAVDEAQHQEQLMRRHGQDLKELRAQKASLTRRAKKLIATSEARRIKAERALAKYDAEISHLTKQIAGLKDEMIQREARAEDAEGLAAEERAELNQYRQERRELLKKYHHKRAPAAASKTTDKDLEAYHEALPSEDEF